MASLYERLKEMTRYDKENNAFELEVEPECHEFYKSLEPLFYVPTSVDDGPALAQPALAPGTPQPRRLIPPTILQLLDLRGDDAEDEDDNDNDNDKDDNDDERDDDVDRTETADINLDAGKVGGGQEPIGSSKRRRGDDDAEDDAEDNNDDDDDDDDDPKAGPSMRKRLRPTVPSDDSDDYLTHKLKRLHKHPSTPSPGDENDNQTPSATKPPASKPSPAKKGPRKPPSKPSSSKTRRQTSTTLSRSQGAEGGKRGGIPPNHTRGPRKWLARLVGTSAEERYAAPPTVLFDIRGEAVELLPSFHHEYARESFLALIRGIRRTCGDRPPDYTSGDGNGTAIKSVPYDVYKQWSPSQVGELLNTKAILVTGVPVEAPESFEGALRGLNRFLDASIICNDQSIDLGPTGNERLRRATLEEIIAISKSPERKAINFLDFPGPLPAGTPLVSDDTLDRVCYSATWSHHMPRKAADMSALTWTIAATPSTWHHVHVDSNGFGTVVVATYGRKLWALIRRKDDPYSSRPIDWAEDVIGYNDAVLDSEDYEVSYVILEPGTALVMPGGCPHMVVTLEDSTVFSGSHFYHGRSIRRHMFSLIISAAMPSATNTEHDECTISIMGRVVEMIGKACLTPNVVPDNLWHHLPEVSTTEGMKDVLVVCAVGRLLPVFFSQHVECQDEVAVISSNALRVARQIQASDKFRFSFAGRPLSFIGDIYEVYLQQVCRIYCHLLSEQGYPIPLEQIRRLRECDDFEPGFRGGPGGGKAPKQPDSLSDLRLDLAVECFIDFVLEK
ncbi:hypothetical protein PTI98_009374 [Pleurotus ostreatus]|nr:hypothetical protein PTI98_009374 [Pleurotus ostreatus]